MAVSPTRVTMKALRAARPFAGSRVPEPDEQVAAEPHALPAQVEQQQVVGQHQDQHGADEQVHVGEEAAVAFLVAHVLGGVEVDEEADEGDHQHHDQGQGVEVEA